MINAPTADVFALESEQVDQTPVDPKISFPCYKSLDAFFDVEQLKSLDRYITERINERLRERRDYLFYTGPYRLQNNSPDRPGSRMIYLSQSSRPDNYFDLDQSELWQPTIAATEEFAPLMDFIRTLPFKDTGRILIMYDDAPRAVTAHRDHTETEICHEFIWFRTNLRKPFYMLNHRTGAKEYVESYSAWFDSVNQYHGSDAFDGLSFSIRVDGHFTDQFKQQIPRPAFNLASTPALWASV